MGSIFPPPARRADRCRPAAALGGRDDPSRLHAHGALGAARAVGATAADQLASLPRIARGLHPNARHRGGFESLVESGGACVLLGERHDAQVARRGALLSSGRHGWEWKVMLAIDGIKRVGHVPGLRGCETRCEPPQLPTGVRDRTIAVGFLLLEEV